MLLQDFAAAMMRVLPEASDRQEAARWIANFEPLGAALATEDARRRMVAAHLPADGWPRRRLEITAVDARSGARVTFDAGSGVTLLDAVTVSGALPGIFPLVNINDTHYCDGGVHSPYNADLAAGHVVIVLPRWRPVQSFPSRELRPSSSCGASVPSRPCSEVAIRPVVSRSRCELVRVVARAIG